MAEIPTPTPAPSSAESGSAPAGAESGTAASATAAAAPGIATLAVRRLRPLSADWAAVLAAAVLATAVSLGWKVTW